MARGWSRERWIDYARKNTGSPNGLSMKIEGAYIVARDSFGNIISKGIAGKDDGKVLQDAVNYATLNEGAIQFTQNHYWIDREISSYKDVKYWSDTPYESGHTISLIGSNLRTFIHLTEDVIDGLFFLESSDSTSSENTSMIKFENLVLDGQGHTNDGIHIGNLYDVIIKDAFIINFGRDGVHVESTGSGSGLRLQNCWIEYNSHYQVFIGDGQRAKLDNLHLVSGVGGLISYLTDSSIHGISIFNNTGIGMEIYGVNNTISDIYMYEVGTTGADLGGYGLYIRSDGQTIDNVIMDRIGTVGLYIAKASNNVISNLNIKSWGSHSTSYYAIHIYEGNNNIIRGAYINQVAYTDQNAIRVYGDNNMLKNIILGDGQSNYNITIDSGSTENIIEYRTIGSTTVTISDSGTRTVINGMSDNNGDPSSGGQWNGYGKRAYELGVIVRDTSVSPANLYKADVDGNWYKIA